MAVALSHEARGEWPIVVLGGGVVNGISLNQKYPADRVDEILTGRQDLMSRWHDVAEYCLKIGSGPQKISSGTVYDALRIVGTLPFAHAQQVLARNLESNNAELQQGAVSALLDLKEPEALVLLLDNFARLTPANQKLAVETLSKNPARKNELTAAIAAKKIPESFLTATPN
jgi:hypothetical protein